MSGNRKSVLTRLVDRVFPRMPDFYSLLNEQCDLAVEAMEVFVPLTEAILLGGAEAGGVVLEAFNICGEAGEGAPPRAAHADEECGSGWLGDDSCDAHQVGHRG